MKTKQYTIKIKRTPEGLRLNDYLCKIHLGKVVIIENNTVGIRHSAHPNIDDSGSVTGMKELGYWPKDCIIIRAHGFIYNVSSVVISDPLDALAYWIEQGGYFNANLNEFTINI